MPGAKSLPPVGGDDGEVFAWHDLTLELGESTLQPLAIHVLRATAGWPYLMMHRGAGGVFPFARGDSTAKTASPATVGEPSPDSAAAAGEATPQAGSDPHAAPRPAAESGILRIDEGRVTHGRIEFYDTTLAPPYWTELAEIDLSFRGLVMQPFVADHFEINGALDWISPLELRGTIGTDKSDLHAQVTQLRLAPLNSYLEPALGYRVTSGLARTDSTIALAGTNLEAENDLVLSRFAMKRTGAEPFEIGMPLPVALALMKNTRGEIHLPLSVRGDLTAQRYRFTNLLLTGLREALVGTLRTPLRLLGSAFRRDQPEQFDLQPVPFTPGSSVLGPEGEERIATLARLLAQHTALRAVLATDPSPADATFFRDEQLIAHLADEAAAARSPTEDTILTFLRARHGGASPAPLPADAAQQLAALETSVALPLDRLNDLADARGAAVVGHLTETHRIASGRVSQTRWKPAEPQAETVPGVDVQLRGD